MSMAIASPFLHVLITFAILAVVAQGASTSSSVSPLSTGASIIPSTASYTYIGCYNETTSNPSVGNVRALAGGNMVRTPYTEQASLAVRTETHTVNEANPCPT